MPTYKQLVDRTSARAEATVAALWAAYEAGRISRAEFDDQATALLDASGQQAGALADTALAARLTELRGETVGPTGIAPGIRVSVLTAAAIQKALELEAARIAARDAVHRAGQDVWIKGLVAQGVEGWRRVTGGGCPVCTRMAQADFIPSSITMWRHTGCGCHPDPVIDDPQGA